MPAGKTGDDHAPPVNPDPGVRSRDQVGVAPTAETAFQRPFNPYPMPHADLAGQFHTAVTPGGIFRVKLRGTCKEDSNPLTGESPGA